MIVITDNRFRLGVYEIAIIEVFLKIFVLDRASLIPIPANEKLLILVSILSIQHP